MKAENDGQEFAKRVKISGEWFFKISDVDEMRPFFMSIASAYDHWMFISSNGGLTAGRRNADFALFPYYTDDKITESAHVTGSKTIIRFKDDKAIWEPFTDDVNPTHKVSRNLYKSEFGNKVIFEEVNHDLKLCFSYEWNSSNKYGFVRKSKLVNQSDKDRSLEIIDGIQNLVPACLGSDMQNTYSNLVDAYKRSELHAASGLGIYALSATIVDRAEPSEALKANTVWSYGLDNPTYLLSSRQLKNFRNHKSLSQETDVKAEKGAYFVSSDILIAAHGIKQWSITANVNQNHSGVIELIKNIESDVALVEKVHADIESGTIALKKLVASTDGLQTTDDPLKDARHFANVMFNLMRGGVFDHHYQIEKSDFSLYLQKANKNVFSAHIDEIDQLPQVFDLMRLNNWLSSIENSSLYRLATEYLPLKFSRRHGDPSRPWNRFSINITNENDGSKVLDYQGNWRDIFQNWEALAQSYPAFIDGMIFRFLNASTFDGYNPYRVTKDGFDWEAIEPDDPWSYIGYWGDHQIIYLLKFLEFVETHKPAQLSKWLNANSFVYAAVPYKIKPYSEILNDPKSTVDFDHEWDQAIRTRRDKMGSDGALLYSVGQGIVQVNFIEKILATTLTKLSNFVPEAGIWLNTQRPEWNDANNALVGNGVSMVTLYYLYRFLSFFDSVLENASIRDTEISVELNTFFDQMQKVYREYSDSLNSGFNDRLRKQMVDKLGNISTEYRGIIYDQGFSGEKAKIEINQVREFFTLCRKYLAQSIDANRKSDQLYHAYNIIEIQDQGIKISYLNEMLEGQVAVLSSGYLSSQETLALLDAMRQSKLYRPDQQSYILYPNKSLPGFLDKNKFDQATLNQSQLLTQLINDGDTTVIEKDSHEDIHFNGNFKNKNDLNKALDALNSENYPLSFSERQLILEIFENVFNHKEFTGRSGTFYGYEGLGSIYWHMVSKLLLAVQESCQRAIKGNEDPELIDQMINHYYEIYEGLGVHKTPKNYGAFTTDPYSHTPGGKGAQQPGMTGQVKEDILCRFGELGIVVEDSKLSFKTKMLREHEFLSEAKEFEYLDINLELKKINLEPKSLGFTYCQVPIIYKLGDHNQIKLNYKDGPSESIDSLVLSVEQSNSIFTRSGEIDSIIVDINYSI